MHQAVVVPRELAETGLHFIDEDVTLAVRAALTGCPGDPLSVRVEVLDPQNEMVPATIDAPQLGENALVNTAVHFRVSRSGTYFVSVTFEPGLGTRSLTLNVMNPYVERGAVITPSQRCAQPPWPVDDETLACELPNEEIGIFTHDGGSVLFQGTQLVAASDVLWSGHGDWVFERREWSDGGLRLTTQWFGVTQRPLAAEHTRLTAMRILDGGLSTVFHSDGGVGTQQILGGLSGVEIGFVHEHPANSLVATVSFAEFVGLEPEVVWLVVPNGEVTERVRPRVEVPTRTVGPRVRRAFVPTSGFTWWPLWVDLDAGTSVMLRQDSVFTAWPTARVLRVGTKHVVLSEDVDAGSYRITRLP